MELEIRGESVDAVGSVVVGAVAVNAIAADAVGVVIVTLCSLEEQKHFCSKHWLFLD